MSKELDLSYCHIHGRYEDYFYRGCPACQIAEQDLRHAEWERRKAVSEAAYAKADPGDYECPYGLYRSLKKRASRCPLCHGEVWSTYLDDVLAREKVNAERKAAASPSAWPLSTCFRGVVILSKGVLGHDIAIKMKSLTISNELTPTIGVTPTIELY